MTTINPSDLPRPPEENAVLPGAQPSLETLALLARRRATEYDAAYALAKGGLATLTRYLAAELARTASP